MRPDVPSMTIWSKSLPLTAETWNKAVAIIKKIKNNINLPFPQKHQFIYIQPQQNTSERLND
jgi:hypothetical protein